MAAETDPKCLPSFGGFKERTPGTAYRRCTTNRARYYKLNVLIEVKWHIRALIKLWHLFVLEATLCRDYRLSSRHDVASSKAYKHKHTRPIRGKFLKLNQYAE